MICLSCTHRNKCKIYESTKTTNARVLICREYQNHGGNGGKDRTTNGDNRKTKKINNY